MRFLRFETTVRPARCAAVVGIWLAMLMPLGAQALEVGNLQVQSRLNEPLRAQMRVDGVGPAGQRGLDVRVADQATYEQLGLVRGSAVENLQFDLTPDADSEGVRVEVRGSRAVREPYVVLLLDVRAPTGRALREFTVLLDPGPLSADAQTAGAVEDIPAPQQGSVPAPEVVTSGTQARLPAPDQPAAPRATPPTAPSSTAAAGNAPVISPQDYRYATTAERPESTVSADESRYGPVRRGESLSSIAQAISSASGVPVAQVMWNLYADNRQNFVNGDINNLKVGAVFDVPTAQAMGQISVAEARRNIRDAIGGTPTERPFGREPVDPPQDLAQAATENDAARTDSSAARVPADPARTAPARTTDTVATEPTPGRSSAPLESTIAGFDDGGMDDDAGVLPEGQFGGSADSDTTASGPQQAGPDAEPGAAAAADKPAGADVGAGETAAPGSGPVAGGLALLSRYALYIVIAVALLVLLIVLLARTRRRQAEALQRAEQEAMSQPRPDLVSLARGEPIPEPTARPMATAATAAAAGVAAASADDDAVERVSFDDAPLSDGSDTTDAATEILPAVDESMLDMPADDRSVAPDDEDAAFAALLAGEADLAEPGDDSDDLANATLDTFDVDFGEDPAAHDSAGQDTSPAADTAAPSMFQTASFPLVEDDSGKSPAVSSEDPVAEAEFQLAYGLYDEAEQTLKAVLEREPDRLDAQEKLAEVYFAAGRESEFEALALGLKREQSDTQQFRNVEKLAQQFIPHSTLFDEDSAAESTPDTAADTAPATTDDGNSIDFALDDVDPDEAPPAPVAAAEPRRDDDPAATVEFSLDDVVASGVTTAAVEEDDSATRDAAADVAEADASDLLDDQSIGASTDDGSFALDDFALDDENLELADLGDSSAESSDSELDFSDLEESLGDDALTLDEMVEEAAPPVPAGEGANADFALDDFELGADDDAADDAQQIPAADPAKATPESGSTDDLSFDAFDDGMAADGDMNSKLDLARGYVDMGEIDMARSLLDEVATRGSADQQVEARAMLDALS